jgi:hypothetical protein
MEQSGLTRTPQRIWLCLLSVAHGSVRHSQLTGHSRNVQGVLGDTFVHIDHSLRVASLTFPPRGVKVVLSEIYGLYLAEKEDFIP